MYDTINFVLRNTEIDFLAETSQYLTNLKEATSPNGLLLYGYIDGLKVLLSQNYLIIKNQSLAKWYLGDNIKTLQRHDVQNAIEKISNLLHLDFTSAIVTRLDFGTNIILNHKPLLYYQFLGTLQHFERVQFKNTLYYNQKNKQICFYDKSKEVKELPFYYKDKNILRYEIRFTKRVAKQLNQKVITAKMLYDENFYNFLFDKYLDYYNKINKLKDKEFDHKTLLKCLLKPSQNMEFFIYETLKKHFENEADFCYFVDNAGAEIFSNKMQKTRVKQLAKKVYSVKNKDLTNKYIDELDKKIKIACSYRR